MKMKQIIKRLVRRIFYKKKSKKHTYLETEILRKDKIIKELKDRNELLIKTIIKQSKESLEIKEKLKEFNNRLK